MENTAWTLNDIISKLCEATNILLHEKNYDGHGYEQIQTCLTLAEKHLSTEQARSVVEPEVMPKIADMERINWLESKMKPNDNYCEIYLAGLRRFSEKEASEYQIEFNPEKLPTLHANTLRDVIDLAMKIDSNFSA